MDVRTDKDRVKVLLADTILALCRNTLGFRQEISVEGLIGITLDKEDVFLVSVNQIVSNETSVSQTCDNIGRKRSFSDDASYSSRDHKTKIQKKRHKRNKLLKSSREVSDSCSCDESSNLESDTDLVNSSSANKDNVSPKSCDVSQGSCEDVDNTTQYSSIKQEIEINSSSVSEVIIVKQESPDSKQDCSLQNKNGPPVLQNFCENGHWTTTGKGQVVSCSISSPGVTPHLGLSPISTSNGDRTTSSDANLVAVSSYSDTASAYPLLSHMHQNEVGNLRKDFSKISVLSESPRKRYTCQLCGLLATSQASLHAHIRVHTGEKPYSCPVCFKSFSRKENLKRHLVALHPDIVPGYSENYFSFSESVTQV